MTAQLFQDVEHPGAQGPGRPSRLAGDLFVPQLHAITHDQQLPVGGLQLLEGLLELVARLLMVNAVSRVWWWWILLPGQSVPAPLFCSGFQTGGSPPEPGPVR